ncbi:MAG: formylglycine-generating enzyme family protein [Thiobacillaceae bacterium]|jgi:formylglycine-generating enzyme required for sulfatase activity
MKAGLGLLISVLWLAANPASKARAEHSAGTVFKEPTTGMEFVWLPGGCFQMGGDVNPSEKPIHKVCIRGFWLGRHEVTQKEYAQVTESNPSYFKGDDRPVEQVNWDEANAFAVQLGKRNGRLMRLPSEAEWEYACRAGGQHDIYCGQGPVSDLGWFGSNSSTRTHPVGQKLPNAWGAADMTGNVWEWVQDCWHSDYAGAPADGSAWAENGNCRQRVFRGGGWFDSLPFLRAAYRNKYEATSRLSYLGFRLVMTQE